LTIPAHGEDGLDSDTVGARNVEVEVVLHDTAGDEIGVDVTSEGGDAVGRLAHRVTSEHPQTLWERRDGLGGRVTAEEVVKSMESWKRDERPIIVHPVKLGHPVVRLVDSDGGGCTGRCDLIGKIV